MKVAKNIAVELGVGETTINDCRETEKYGKILHSHDLIMSLNFHVALKKMETGNCR